MSHKEQELFHSIISTRDVVYRASEFFSPVVGIIVQSVYPHHVSTKMSRVRPSLTQPTADQYAASLLATLGLESETTGYLFHWFPMGIIMDLVPQWLLMKFIKPMGMSVRARALKKKMAKKE